jgi:hypothetical protein
LGTDWSLQSAGVRTFRRLDRHDLALDHVSAALLIGQSGVPDVSITPVA